MRTLAIGLALLIAGCVHQARVPDTVKLKDDEGVIVYRMFCGKSIAYGEFFETGRNAEGYFAGLQRAGALLCPPGMQTKRLKAGKYFVGKIGYTGWIDISEEDAMQFSVAPGKLNYIGHIHFPSAIEQSHIKTVVIGDPIVQDHIDEVRKWLDANQPALLANYDLIPALAKPPSE